MEKWSALNENLAMFFLVTCFSLRYQMLHRRSRFPLTPTPSKIPNFNTITAFFLLAIATDVLQSLFFHPVCLTNNIDI